MPGGPLVILLGPPGVGKGTQGVLLAERSGWRHVATGDLLRAHRRDGTELGRKAQAYMDRGELVPDLLIIDMVRDELASLAPEKGVVFDGFPRTVPQAEALGGVLGETGRKVSRVVVLEAEDETIVDRVSGRRSCPSCGAVYNVRSNPPREQGRCDRCGNELVQRQDDRPETVRTRLSVYHEETAPLVRFYERGQAHVVRVPGDRTVEEVSEDVLRAALTPGLDGGAMEIGA